MGKNNKTQTFAWEGTNAKGDKVKGFMQGVNSAYVKAQLRRQSIKPTKVGKKKESLFTKGKKITSSDITAFSRQLATLASAGVPLTQSLEITGRGHSNPTMQELLLSLKSDIESGSTLSEALGKFPQYFNELYCNLVNAGEQSGSLETMLDKIAMYKEKSESLRRKIKKALFYPSAVLIIALIITMGILLFIVPQFEAIFKSFGAELPMLTQVVVNLSNILQDYWWMVFIGIGVAAFAYVKASKTSKSFADFIERTQLKLPIIGNIIKDGAVARFTRTLATTFAAGMPLIDALEAVAGATGNIVYSDATLRIADEIKTGSQIQQAMQNANIFPNMVIQMVAIGEESGSLEAMLNNVADTYEEEVDTAVDSLSSLLEPVIMVILGVLIGGVVVAMYLPIFKLGSVI